MAKVILTEEELQEMCKDYQKLLRIQDWRIQVRIVDQASIGNADGKIAWDCNAKEAFLQIPTEDTRVGGNLGNGKEQNMRLSLIHELIHICFGYADPQYEVGTLEFAVWEASIDSVAEAFDTLVSEREYREGE